MAIYHYKDSPLVESIEIKSQNIGFSATIMLRENASLDQIDELIMQLASRDFPTMRDIVDGKPALQVRGMKNEQRLLSASDKLNLKTNTAGKETTLESGKEKFIDRVKKSPLFLSAVFYDLADMAFIVSGIQRGRHNPDGKLTRNDISEMAIGAAFGLGDMLMTMYGKENGAEELSAAAEGLRNHLREKGVIIPEGDNLNPDTLYKSGVLREIHNWMHKNVLFVKCLAETGGGLFMMGSALKPGNRNNGKLAAGLLLATSWLSTLILEKPRGYKIFDVDKDKPASLSEKIKGNPRAWLASPGSIANNFLNYAGSYQERKRWKDHPTRKNDYIYNVFSASSFLTANILFGISGQKRPPETEADKEISRDLVLMAANTLASQPELSRAAIDETAEYVSTKLAHVSMSKEEAAKAIMDKVTELNRNSWVARTQPSSSSPNAAI